MLFFSGLPFNLDALDRDEIELPSEVLELGQRAGPNDMVTRNAVEAVLRFANQVWAYSSNRVLTKYRWDDRYDDR